MKVYAAILRTLLGRSVLLSLLCALLVSMPLLAQLWGTDEPGIKGSAVVAAGSLLLCWWTAMLLGSTMAGLSHRQARQTIPGYSRRLLAVGTMLGLLIWAPVPLFHPWGELSAGALPWMRWTPLLAYGLMGSGFLMGVSQRALGMKMGREKLLRLALFAASWLLPVTVLVSAGFRDWLATPLQDELPGVNLLTLACLLAGPLTWPSFAWLLPNDRAQAVSSFGVMEEQSRRGNLLGNWTLSGMLERSHDKNRLRLEFLVFSPGLLALCTGVLGPVILCLLVLLLPNANAWLGDPTSVMKLAGVPFGMLTFIASVTPLLAPVVQTRSLGRALLLPGQWRRSTLPEKLFGRMLTLSLLGAGVILAPTCVIVPLLGTPWLKLLLLAVLLLWSISVCASLVFWRIPRRSQTPGVDPVILIAFMLLALATSVADFFLFVDFSTATSLAIMALAFALPVLLYRSGLKRWRAMEYGA